MERARQIVDTKWAHDRKILGKGIGVAILDTGLSPHPDFITGGMRIAAFYDTLHHQTRPYDDGGHGTHVAGIIGGNGHMSGGRFLGMAPACHLIGVKVLNRHGDGDIPDVLRGIDYVIQNRERYNIRIVNISVGTKPKKVSDDDKRLLAAVDSAWDHGLIVVAAAGNNGPEAGSISLPGISRKIITVGASDDTAISVMRGGRPLSYSGCGPTGACILKPDLCAPGSHIISCRSLDLKGRLSAADQGPFYTAKSGTSMATPIVAGAIALLLSKEPGLSGKDVKLRLLQSAVDLGLDRNKQGRGVLSVRKLLE